MDTFIGRMKNLPNFFIDVFKSHTQNKTREK